MNTGNHVSTLLILLFGLFLTACSDEKPATNTDASAVPATTQDAVTQAADARNADGSDTKGPAMTQTSRDGYFQVTLQSEVTPLPLNEIHRWTARIATPEGKLVDDAVVMVYGGMPEHKHGFPSKPQVTGHLGDGRYQIDGIKFNMPGRWEMWLNVRAFGKDDKVIFSFDVP
jgi:hypothetical protein